jgi:hypothetical protein
MSIFSEYSGATVYLEGDGEGSANEVLDEFDFRELHVRDIGVYHSHEPVLKIEFKELGLGERFLGRWWQAKRLLKEAEAQEAAFFDAFVRAKASEWPLEEVDRYLESKGDTWGKAVYRARFEVATNRRDLRGRVLWYIAHSVLQEAEEAVRTAKEAVRTAKEAARRAHAERVWDVMEARKALDVLRPACEETIRQLNSDGGYSWLFS